LSSSWKRCRPLPFLSRRRRRCRRCCCCDFPALELPSLSHRRLLSTRTNLTRNATAGRRGKEKILQTSSPAMAHVTWGEEEEREGALVHGSAFVAARTPPKLTWSRSPPGGGNGRSEEDMRGVAVWGSSPHGGIFLPPSTPSTPSTTFPKEGDGASSSVGWECQLASCCDRTEARRGDRHGSAGGHEGVRPYLALRRRMDGLMDVWGGTGSGKVIHMPGS
jgi:hypothetical protein